MYGNFGFPVLPSTVTKYAYTPSGYSGVTQNLPL